MLEVNQVYLGDCLNIMQSIDDKSIDLILCDLPYQITNLAWDNLIPFDKLWAEYKRIRKDNAATVLFGQEPFSSALRLSNLEEFKYDWYWQKERATNIMQLKRRPAKVIETISVFYKEQCVYNPQMTKYEGKPRTNKVKDGKLGQLVDASLKKPHEYVDNGTRYPLQIQQFKRDILTSNLHPCQKPDMLLQYLIRTYTNENAIVFDSCAGSGSTLLAAKKLNRSYIGIEKEEKYYEIIKERLK